MIVNVPFIENFKIFKSLPRIIKLFTRLLKDKRVPLSLKFLLAGGLLYFFAPLDINPDYIPFFGYLDDLAVFLLVLERFMLLAPKDLVKESLSNSQISEEEISKDLANLSSFLGARLVNMRKNLENILNKYWGK